MASAARRGRALAGAPALVLVLSSALLADPPRDAPERPGPSPAPARPAGPDDAKSPLKSGAEKHASAPDPTRPLLRAEQSQSVFPSGADDTAPRAGASDWGALLPFLGWTGFVLLLLGGALLFVRRLVPATRRRLGADAVRPLIRRSLSPHHTVYVLEVGPRLLVVGATKTGLAPLAEFRDPEEVARVKALCPPRPEESTSPSFQERLREGMQPYEQAAPPARDPAARAELDEALSEIADIKRMIVSWK